MTSFQKARYALWNHESQTVNEPVEWRVTPRSNKYVAVVRPVVLPGAVIVDSATSESIEVRIDAAQADAISHWTSGLPSSVMPSTAETHRVIAHAGPYVRVDSSYTATARVPKPGDRVSVRLVVGVDHIGPLKKTHLVVTDVRLDDIAPADSASQC